MRDSDHVVADADLLGRPLGAETDHDKSGAHLTLLAGPILIGKACSQFPHVFGWIEFHYPRNGKVGFNGTLYAAAQTFAWYKQHLGVTKAADFFYPIPISRQAGLLFAKLLRTWGSRSSTTEGVRTRGRTRPRRRMTPT